MMFSYGVGGKRKDGISLSTLVRRMNVIYGALGWSSEILRKEARNVETVPGEFDVSCEVEVSVSCPIGAWKDSCRTRRSSKDFSNRFEAIEFCTKLAETCAYKSCMKKLLLL